MPYSCDDKLRYTANGHTSHEEHTAAAYLGDDTAVDYDDEDAHSCEDTSVHERTADSCNLEEVRAVGWNAN
jgi:hypothetical protein